MFKYSEMKTAVYNRAEDSVKDNARDPQDMEEYVREHMWDRVDIRVKDRTNNVIRLVWTEATAHLNGNIRDALWAKIIRKIL